MSAKEKAEFGEFSTFGEEKFSFQDSLANPQNFQRYFNDEEHEGEINLFQHEILQAQGHQAESLSIQNQFLPEDDGQETKKGSSTAPKKQRGASKAEFKNLLPRIKRFVIEWLQDPQTQIEFQFQMQKLPKQLRDLAKYRDSSNIEEFKLMFQEPQLKLLFASKMKHKQFRHQLLLTRSTSNTYLFLRGVKNLVRMFIELNSPAAGHSPAAGEDIHLSEIKTD